MKKLLLIFTAICLVLSLQAQEGKLNNFPDSIAVDQPTLQTDSLLSGLDTVAAIDSSLLFEEVSLTLTLDIECDGKQSTISWDLKNLDSTEKPNQLMLYRYPEKGQDSIKTQVHAFDSNYLAVENGYEVKSSGYYYLASTDSLRKIHFRSNALFVDICNEYQLPESFRYAPNKYYTPTQILNIEKVEMVIFDSRGNQVFFTEDPNIQWDGRNQESGSLCAPGTYFYNCDFFERKSNGLIRKNLTGIIQLIY